MKEPETQFRWLDFVSSGSPTVYAICLTILVVFFLLAFSPGLRGIIDNRIWRFVFGDKTLESLPTQQPAQEPAEVSDTALASPPAIVEEEEPELPKAIPEEELPLEEDDEMTLHHRVISAGFGDRDPEKVEIAYQKLKSFRDRQTTDEHLETLRVNMLLAAGVDAGEEELKELEQKNRTWLQPSFSLMRYYGKLKRFDLALPHAELAIHRSENDSDKAFSYNELADILLHEDTQDGALEVLNRALQEIFEDEAKASVLDKIAEIYESKKDRLNVAKAREHALTLTPSNKKRRFDAAYNYSKDNKQHLALYHYQILTNQDPKYKFAMNNLGVAYDRLKLPGKCIESWERAAYWGEAHPIGNIAIQYIDNGFYDDARRVLDAIDESIKDDPQIVSAINLIKSRNDYEEQELDEHQKAMEVHHEYMLLAIESEQDPELNELQNENFIGDWTSNSGAKLNMNIAEGLGLFSYGQLTGVLIEISSGGLTGLLGGVQTTQQKYSIFLNLSGAVLSGKGHHMPEQSSRTSLLSADPKSREYFLVVTGKNEIKGTYWTEEKRPIEISFNRN